MSDDTFEKHLVGIFESGLHGFLSLPVLERLEKAKSLFRWNDKEFHLVFEKFADFIKQDIDDKTDEERESYLRNLDDNLKAYLSREYQQIFYYLPFFLWASHIIFDGTYSQLTYEAREQLRSVSGLDTPKKRKNAYVNLFNRFTDEKVVDGGSQSHWNKWTKLHFLSLYERFSVVIENARKDIKMLKHQKIAVMDIKKEILEKHRIPEDYWNDVSKRVRKDKLARKWATNRMQCDFDEKYTQKMGFADSYLIKILETARKEAQKHLSCNCKNYNNHKLIFLKWGDTFLHSSCVIAKDDLAELKFDSFVEEEFPGMILYFVNGHSI